MRNSSLTVLCAIIMAALLAGHGAAFGAEMDGIMMNHGKMMMMKDGKPVMTVTITVAKDGKSRTVSSTPIGGKGKSETDMAYYDKE